jgi:hypothetical protein
MGQIIEFDLREVQHRSGGSDRVSERGRKHRNSYNLASTTYEPVSRWRNAISEL